MSVQKIRGSSRLYVVLEQSTDYNKFKKKPFIYDKVKQNKIKDHFLAFFDKEKIENSDSLFVVFGNFEKVYYEEINESITKKDLNRIAYEIDKENIWGISNMFDATTVFYYSDSYLAKIDKVNIKDRISEKLFSLLKKKDQFGYCAIEKILIYFDTKENFDNNYQSNWYYYYK